MSDLSFYGPAGLLLLAFLCKVPGLIREPRELLQRSVAMLLLPERLAILISMEYSHLDGRATAPTVLELADRAATWSYR